MKKPGRIQQKITAPALIEQREMTGIDFVEKNGLIYIDRIHHTKRLAIPFNNPRWVKVLKMGTRRP